MNSYLTLPTTHGLKYKRLITRYTARKTGQCRVGPGPGVGARRWCGTGAAVPAPVPPAGIVLVARLRSECTPANFEDRPRGSVS